MPELTWIISIDRQGFLGSSGVSTTYIVPRGEMNDLEQDLIQNNVWVVIRGSEDRCVAVFTINRVERFSEGFHENDFVIYPDMTRSLRLCSNYEEAKNYSITPSIVSKSGISKFSVIDADSLKKKISQNLEVKFTIPTGFDKIPLKFVANSDIDRAISTISKIVENFNLNQMWGSGSGLRLNPISNFAANLLIRKFGNEKSEGVLKEIALINPLKSILSINDFTESSDKFTFIRNRKRRGVDITFTEIIPENIYARVFISGPSSYYDLEHALAKTDIAERHHQLMLKDISEYLKSMGIVSYESTSIDLMIDLENRMKIFEIKSVNIDNLLMQAAKGSFQIACYATSLKDGLLPFKAGLIINKIRDENILSLVLVSLNYLNIDCLIYDPEAKWPDRLPGLLE
ncbi:MAG: hypothetical protein EOO20_07775 [Chryseobacterium sp.]|nr:MAG: hypothetical protein EOO20_07775 [Chryseobacterium sp.]